MKKILILHPKNTQMFFLTKKINKDPYFKKNFQIYEYPSLSTKIYKNRDLSSFDLIISPVHFNTINKDYVKTNKKQIVIELTHGTWVKKLNSNMIKKRGGINLILATCPWAVEVFKNAGYSDSEIIKADQPRNEYYKSLSQDSIRKKLNKLFNIDPETKIVIYAPSWIKVEKKVKINLDYLISRLKSDETLLVLPHINSIKRDNIKYLISKSLKNKVHIDYDRKIKAEIAMLSASKLITDYSSIIYDYMNLFPEREYELFFPESQDSKLIKYFKPQYETWGKIGKYEIDKNNPNIDIPELKYFKNENEETSDLLIKRIKEMLE